MNYKSELTHHDIFNIFNHDTSIFTINLYTSFIGDYQVNIRNGYITNNEIIIPQKITLSRAKPNNELLVDIFGNAGAILDSINDIHNPKNNTITHIEWFINFKYMNGMKIVPGLIEKIRLFKDIADAEIHYIDQVHNYLKKNKIDTAIMEYNKLIEIHSEISPDKILNIIGN